MKRIQLSKKRRKMLGVAALAALGVMCLAFTDAVASLGLQTALSNAAQALVDECVGFFWKALLCALVVLGFYKLLLEAALLMIGLKVAGIGLLLLLREGTNPRATRQSTACLRQRYSRQDASPTLGQCLCPTGLLGAIARSAGISRQEVEGGSPSQ